MTISCNGASAGTWRRLTGSRGVVGIVVFVGLLFGRQYPSVQADDLSLVVTSEPQGTAQPLNLEVAKSEMSATFFVRNESDKELKNIRLRARLQETTKPHGSTELRLSGENRHVDDGSLTLAPKEEIAVELRATGLPLGKSTGFLMLEQGTTKVRLAELSFDYKSEPLLKFIGLAEGGTLSATCWDGNFKQTFRLQSQNATPIKELRVTLDSLAGPDGAQRPVVIEGPLGSSAVALNGLGTFDVTVVTELPHTGVYRGTLVLSYDERLKEVPFTITRGKRPSPFEILATEAVRVDLVAGHYPVRLRVGIHELNGVGLQTTLPELSGLHASAAGQKSYQTGFSRLEWTDDSDRIVTSLNLGAGETRNLWLRIYGIAAAGEHSGSLRHSLPDGQVVAQNISIVARHHWLFAVVVISLGVGGSVVMRLLSSGAINIQEQIQLSRIDGNIVKLLATPNLPADGALILTTLRTRGAELYATSQLNRGKSYTAEIAEIDRKVRLTPRWIAARDATATIIPPATEILNRLNHITQSLIAQDASGAKLDAITNELAAVESEIQTKRRDTLLSSIKELQTQVGIHQRDPEASHELSGPLRALTAELMVATTEVNLGNYQTGSEKFNEVRRRLVVELAVDLNRKIADRPSAAGVQFKEAVWAPYRPALVAEVKRVEQEVGQGLDLDLLAYYRARANFALQVVRCAQETARAQLESDRNATNEQRNDLQRTLAKWKSLAEKLTPMVSAAEIKPAELMSIEFEMKRPIESLEEFAAQPQGVKSTQGAAPASVSLPAAWSPAPLSTTEEIPLTDGADLRQKQRLAEAFLAVLSIVIAVLFGMKLLWVENVVWGTPGDYLIAALWGLGLHQVANATFDFDAFVRRLTTREPSRA